MIGSSTHEKPSKFSSFVLHPEGKALSSNFLGWRTRGLESKLQGYKCVAKGILRFHTCKNIRPEMFISSRMVIGDVKKQSKRETIQTNTEE